MSQSRTAESQQLAEQSAPVVSGHTPTPWALGYTERCILREIPGMCDGEDGYAVAITSAHSLLPVSEAKANAAFIVRAVNSHEALVKALETFVEEYTQLVNSGDAGFWDPETEPKVIAARAALASTREVQP